MEQKQTASSNTMLRKEIDPKELFYRMLDKWKLIALCVFLGAGLALAYTVFAVTPKYRATAKIYVLSSSDSVINVSDLQLGTYLASDYKEVLRTREVNERAVFNLGLPFTYEEMLKMTAVDNPSGTRILEISAQTDSPDLSASIANELSVVASDYIAEVMQTDRPTILSVAVAPQNPSTPHKVKNTVIGALIGGVLIAAYILIDFLSDNKIKSADELAEVSMLPVFAQIPETDMKQRTNLLKTSADAGKLKESDKTAEREQKQ